MGDFDPESGGATSDGISETKRPPSCRLYVWDFLSLNMAELPLCLYWGAIAYHVSTAALVVILIIVDNTTSPTVTTMSYWVCELFATILWTCEYMLRLWSSVEQRSHALTDRRSFRDACRFRVREALKPQLFLDLLAIASLIIDLSITDNNYRGFSSLRMLRLITVVRIERGFLFSGVMTVVSQKIQLLGAALGIALIVMLVASVLMFYIENQANPAFSSVLISMWWCTTALTTVGYGDIYPTTGLGRCLGSIVAFMGIGLFAMPAGILASGFQEQIESKHRAWRRQKRREIRRLSQPGRTEDESPKDEQSPIAAQEAMVSEVAEMRKELRHVTTSMNRQVSDWSVSLSQQGLGQSSENLAAEGESPQSLQSLRSEVREMREEMRQVVAVCVDMKQTLMQLASK